MSKAKMLAARELIQEKNYEEARALLKTVNSATASRWLERLDQIVPPITRPVGTEFVSPVIEWLIDAHPEVVAQYITRSGVSMPPDEILLRLREAWIPRLTDTVRDRYPKVRAAVGRALGQLKLSSGELLDNRPGVGVIVREDGLKLPDIDWVEILDDAEWNYQEDKHPGLPTFRIARYPVTFVQFQCFVDAPDHDDNRWWAGMPEEEEAWGTTYRTRELDEQRFRYANHPRERVAWYQAVAFCRWLSDKLGYEVTLPTEQQWEKAARGTDRCEYPYGSKFDAAKGNTRETGIEQTSAVGIFPSGASPYGVLDMSGNVWEWCLNKYKAPDDVAVDASGSSRVLRGGSWYVSQVSARAVFRDFCYPLFRVVNIGFRLLCRPHFLNR